jgi:hypothetical protein
MACKHYKYLVLKQNEGIGPEFTSKYSHYLEASLKKVKVLV